MPSNNPKLSVLLPAYNAEKYIHEAIDSILGQSFKDFELIISDDGSKDKTKTIIDSYSDSRIVISHNKSNQGKVVTVNRLLNLSNGDYLTIHDADDISLKSRFEIMIDFLERNKTIMMCGCNFISFKNNRIIEKSDLKLDYQTIKKEIKTKSVFHGPTLIFRKEIIPKVGGLYRYFEQAEDIDFTMRVAEKFECANLENHLYLYRYVANSLTKKFQGFNVERMVNAKILYKLAQQREETGTDMLMSGSKSEFESFKTKWSNIYLEDLSSIFRFGAFFNLSVQMYSNSLILSAKAFLNNPFDLLNLKCLIYIILQVSIKAIKSLFLRKKSISSLK